MGVADGIGVVDTMMGLPGGDRRWWAASMAPLLLDEESRSQFDHAAGYMFKDLPDDSAPPGERASTLLAEMDRWGVEQAIIGVDFRDPASIAAVKDYPDRLLGSMLIDPNQGMHGVRALVRAYEEAGIVAAAFFPCGCVPQVPIDDRKVYPLYAKCVELNLPVFMNTGVPGPRVPMKAQDVELLDEICWFFPDLKVVMRHGGEPWTDLAVKLMIKYPNLYYSTSAFAPRYYPKAIIDFANTSRGADRVMYAGYYPSGLSLERIFTDFEKVPFKPEVWPKFLRTNALALLGRS